MEAVADLQQQQQQPAAERQFIDLVELQAELDATKALFSAWASDTTKAAEECRRRHAQDLRGLKGACDWYGRPVLTRPNVLRRCRRLPPTTTFADADDAARPHSRNLSLPLPLPPRATNPRTHETQQTRWPRATSSTARPSAPPRRRASVSGQG